ncbi:hypothetical protein CQ14_06625 [Bradyrhizobium lablabi]|uniref:Helix-turn-helix domain-containing protein n=1 Tax=Bradyrhizobium lablabi TaxID=722472 RepID=A0A0R3MVM4_9BRAD|nr:hypothetical protein [Bradyrhizobium lablabi]KRR21318.1 hypothetical protein CQ14_06625 [Bradyrhizobium lablabi]
MSKYALCSCCKQPLPSLKRGGVYLPPRKAQIFDTIDRNPGISALGIIAKCYNGNATTNAVRVHVAQINCLLMESGVRIRISGDGIDMRGSYRIVRPQEGKVAA